MNVEKLQKLYFGLFNWGKKQMIARGTRRTAKKRLNDPAVLTPEEKKMVQEFWAPYTKIDVIHHAFLKEKTGKFHKEWLPQDVYLNIVDEYFNDRDASQILDNKSLYFRLFPDIPQIPSVVSRMGDLWYDENHHLVTLECVKSLIAAEPALFVKAATRSYGGLGVVHISGQETIVNQFEEAIKHMPGDIVVQRPIRQHATFAKLHEASVNTLRVLSLLTEEGVKIYSAVVRMGVNNAKVDNATSGGIFCGVKDDETLGAIAYKLSGESFTQHPNSEIVFDGYRIVGYDKAKELIKKAHPMVPYFKMVSWDIAINEEGEPVMLEANFAKGCLNFHQLTKGPLFGEDTKKILDKIFGKA